MNVSSQTTLYSLPSTESRRPCCLHRRWVLAAATQRAFVVGDWHRCRDCRTEHIFDGQRWHPFRAVGGVSGAAPV